MWENRIVRAGRSELTDIGGTMDYKKDKLKLFRHYQEQIQSIFKDYMKEDDGMDGSEKNNTLIKLINFRNELINKHTEEDRNRYISVLKNMLKEIKNIISWIKGNDVKSERNRLLFEISHLKDMFLDIGEIELFKQSNLVEILLKQEEDEFEDNYLSIYIKHIDMFISELENFLSKIQIEYNNLESNNSKSSSFLSDEEYEQCLLNTIYYIKVLDYDSIINELVKLVHLGKPLFREELKKALQDILDFEYDKALKRIINVEALYKISTMEENKKSNKTIE